jgi:beta-galactosidase
MHVDWPAVIYEPGVLEARGYRGGEVAAIARVETAGEPHALRLWKSRDWLRADRQDSVVVNVAVVDERNRVVPDASNLVRFDLDGKGKVLGTGNGDPASHEEEKGSRRRVFHGLCQAILGAGGETGYLTLTVSANGLLPARLELEVRA